MKYNCPANYNKEIIVKKDKTSGYEYFFDKQHPLSSKYGKVYYHRHVYSLKINEWVSSSLVVHHKDGNKQNNSQSNLSAISRRLHNRVHAIERGWTLTSIKNCKYCGEKFISVNGSCFCKLSCSSSHHLVGLNNLITKEELQKLVWEIPTTDIAKRFNCSDVAIYKLCKRLGVEKPSRGYWAKKRSKIKNYQQST